jgi:NADH-quinone oxidoreductase subunit M
MIIVLLLPKEKKRAIQSTTAIMTGLQVLLAILIWMAFDMQKPESTIATMQFVERLPWIVIPETPWFGEIRIEYFMGIDGLSMPMVLLTALISFLATFSSFSITKSRQGLLSQCSSCSTRA